MIYTRQASKREIEIGEEYIHELEAQKQGDLKFWFA